MSEDQNKKGQINIELDETWKDKYQALTTKHIKMLDFFNVDIQYNLKELEEEFCARANPDRVFARMATNNHTINIVKQ